MSVYRPNENLRHGDVIAEGVVDSVTPGTDRNVVVRLADGAEIVKPFGEPGDLSRIES